jgi:large subunit ribosomal protein L13
MKTYSPKPEHIEHRWYVIDAGGKVLGRVASEAAALLRGKHKPIFAPHMDTGDNVIIVNAAKVELTGGKDLKKFEYRHSGYPGGITATAYGKLMHEKPAYVVEKAIRGMLPKNRLGRAMIKKLHVVPGPEHRHQAQHPVPYTLGQPPMWEGIPAPKPRRSAKPKVEKPVAAEGATEATAPPARKTTARKAGSKATSTAKSTATSSAKSTAKSTAKATSKSPAKKTSARKPAAKKTPTKTDEE